MTKSEVKTFIKTYKTAWSAIEQLLQQFSTSVASGAEDNSSSMGSTQVMVKQSCMMCLLQES